jgi:hypothetical protein
MLLEPTKVATLEIYVKVKVMFLLGLTKHYAMKMNGRVEIYCHRLFTSVLDGGGQLHAPAALLLGERASGTH